MSDFATSAGHWYEQDGTPRYTLTGKNGKERNTTLRDARELNLLPSVTTIIRCASAPALENWKVDQGIMAALTLPRRDGELEVDWLKRVKQDSQEQGKRAAERGTQIHGAVERYIRGERPDDDLWPWARVAKELLPPGQTWHAERSFGSTLGYGGKTDLHSSDWVIDIKTKDGVEGATLYDEHPMQLVAYMHGLGLPSANAGILFLDRTNPTGVFVRATEEELERGWDMFRALLKYWQAKNKYRPEFRMAA